MASIGARSQYDFIDGFAKHMRDALPKASFIGFTGTPIEKRDRNTIAVFGDCIDVYDIEQAVNDGATVRIFYESRLAQLELKSEEKPKIDPEFEEVTDPLATLGSGDVKYHLGATGKYRSPRGNEIHVSVAPNPSHLEWVNPVIEGIVRAKQERLGDVMRERVIPVLVHGDAAFAGQGIVWETLNHSQLFGYRTGGTMHVIINNQIGL